MAFVLKSIPSRHQFHRRSPQDSQDSEGTVEVAAAVRVAPGDTTRELTYGGGGNSEPDGGTTVIDDLRDPTSGAASLPPINGTASNSASSPLLIGERGLEWEP